MTHGEVTDAEVKEFEKSFQRDLAAFDEQLPVLLKQYQGEFVAILDGKIVEHHPSRESLAAAIRERFPNRFVLLEQVVPPETNAPVKMESIRLG